MGTIAVRCTMGARQGAVYIGIDDTDNLESRGTGFRARQLADAIAAEDLGVVVGVTRHQLFVSPEIPYTSHNSAACLAVWPRNGVSGAELVELCRDFLVRESAPGSDAGFSVVSGGSPLAVVLEFGVRAKEEVVSMEEARRLAATVGAHLEGVTGDHGGIIGALAATGLRFGGEDGRYLWVHGLREMAGMTLTVKDLLDRTGLDTIETREGMLIDEPAETIELGEWPRPVVRSHRAVLVVEKSDDTISASWRVVPKDYIKQF